MSGREGAAGSSFQRKLKDSGTGMLSVLMSRPGNEIVNCYYILNHSNNSKSPIKLPLMSALEAGQQLTALKERSVECQVLDVTLFA